MISDELTLVFPAMYTPQNAKGVISSMFLSFGNHGRNALKNLRCLHSQTSEIVLVDITNRSR